MLKKLLCKLGIHWMKNQRGLFTDKVSGNTVFVATCPCGREWTVDSLFPIVVFKVETSDSVRQRKEYKVQCDKGSLGGLDKRIPKRELCPTCNMSSRVCHDYVELETLKLIELKKELSIDKLKIYIRTDFPQYNEPQQEESFLSAKFQLA